MKSKNSSKWTFLMAACLFILSVAVVYAEDKFETLIIGDIVYKGVTLKNPTPADIQLHHEGGIAKIKLQDLPDGLKAKYPFDAAKAAEYEKVVKENAKKQKAYDTGSALSGLLAKEAQIRARLETLDLERKRLNKEISVLEKQKGGNPNKAQVKAKLVEMRATKSQVLAEIYKLEDDLKRNQAQQQKFK